jgi:hypothetical protein
MPTPHPQGSDEFEKFVSIKAAAELINCSVKSIRRKLDQHPLKGKKVGEFWTFRLGALMELIYGPPEDARTSEAKAAKAEKRARRERILYGDDSAGETASPSDSTARQSATHDSGDEDTQDHHRRPQSTSHQSHSSHSSHSSHRSHPKRPPKAPKHERVASAVEALNESDDPRQRLIDIAAMRAATRLLEEMLRRKKEGPRRRTLPPQRIEFSLLHVEQSGAPHCGERNTETATEAMSTSSDLEKEYLQNSCEIQNLNLLNSIENDPAAGWCKGAHVPPKVAALQLQHTFKTYARHLARRDVFLREDLCQEMLATVLKCREPHCLKYFREAALWRAMDYLDYERLRGTVPLDVIANRGTKPPDSDTILVRWPLKREVKVSEIEAALGVKIVFEERPNPKRVYRRHPQYRRHGA